MSLSNTNYNKCFQHNPKIAFSHEQQKACMTGGYLLAETGKFRDIADCLFLVNPDVLQALAKHMADGEVVKLATDDKKDVLPDNQEP